MSEPEQESITQRLYKIEVQQKWTTRVLLALWAAVLSPKFGGPDVSAPVTALVQHFT